LLLLRPTGPTTTTTKRTDLDAPSQTESQQERFLKIWWLAEVNKTAPGLSACLGLFRKQKTSHYY
jgi:hypothetical protein